MSRVAPKWRVAPSSSVSFWTQPDRSWLVGYDGDWVPSRTLPMLSFARRGSRSGSELPPFDPCTASATAGPAVRSGSGCHRITSWAGIAPARLSSCQEPRFLRLIPASGMNAVVSQRIARRTRHGDHSPCLSSELYMRLSHSYSSPADGSCHSTPLISDRDALSLRGEASWPLGEARQSHPSV